MRKKYASVLIKFALLMGASGVACAAQIQCESTGRQYHICPATTGNGVRLVQQLSSTPCRQGQTWGYDGRGIWVDNGCRAVFEYHEYGSGPSYGDGHHHGHGGDVAGAVAGALIIAAIAGSSHSRPDRDDQQIHSGAAQVPHWAIGTFSGGDTASGSDISLAIGRDGQVSGYYGHSQLQGQFAGNSVWLGRRRYSVQPTNDGMRLVANDDPSMVIFLNRD